MNATTTSDERISDELIVDSVTGVDVTLPVVGPGGRSYAFVIDWHIRLLVALAWLFIGTFTLRLVSADVGVAYAFAVAAPALAIYFLYHPVLEVLMRGRTPGKRMAGVRIVTREGATPGIGAILVRNVFRLVDALPAFYCLGLACTLFTKQNVRIGDLAAGTLLVYDRGETSIAKLPGALSSGTLSPQLAELVEDLLQRWNELTPDARSTLARRIFERVEPDGEYIPELDLQPRLMALLRGQAQ